MVEAIAPLQSNRSGVWGGEKWDPGRSPITSALYELGLPGTQHITMRPSSSIAEASEAGGEPRRLPSVYVQSGWVPVPGIMYAVSPATDVTSTGFLRRCQAVQVTGRGSMVDIVGGPNNSRARVYIL